MKKIIVLFVISLMIICTLSSFKFVNDEIPEIMYQEQFTKIPAVAQYGESDWSQVFGIAHNVTLEEAKEIAMYYPEITYFFYMKGRQMVLGTGRGDDSWRKFVYRDAVFFRGEPWWGDAGHYSDGYIKN